MKIFGLYITTSREFDETILLKCFKAYNDGFKDAIRVYQNKPLKSSYLDAAKSYMSKEKP
jgi:hypothetical protein